MSDTAPRPLKALNMKWLALLALADVLALVWITTGAFPVAALTPEGAERLLVSTLAPLVVLLLVNVLPHDVKAILVYWKPRGVLPGCEAFTRHGPRDPRVDMAALACNAGPFPSAPTEQNAAWYRLYKQVASEPEVSDAHRASLLYRDMAVLSLLFLLAGSVALWLISAPAGAIVRLAALLTLQYLIAALSARWSGVRFVCNVLAVHSARSAAVTRETA